MVDKPDSPTEKLAASAKWHANEDMPQAHADEATLSYIADRVFLSFGAIQRPAPGEAAPPTQVHVLEVAKIALTEVGFHKLFALMKRVEPKITKRSEEEADDDNN